MATGLSDDELTAAGEVLREVAIAEAAGDPAEALRLTEECSTLVDSPNAWVLRTLVDLGDEVPDWMWSRWMTMQAHRGDLSGEEPVVEPSLERIVAAAYVNDVDVTRRPEFAPQDFWTTLVQCDWIVRQLRVYEGGGLRDLVERRGSPRLLTRAGQIDAWVEAPMSGLQLDSLPVGPTVQLIDLASGERLDVLNLGLACDHGTGTPFIGRLVPTAVEPGLVFEWSPLKVDLPTARDVAALRGRPDQWVEILTRAHGEWRLPGMYSWNDELNPMSDISFKAFARLLRPHQLAAFRSSGRDLIVEMAVEACANALRLVRSNDEELFDIGPLVTSALLWPGAFAAVRRRLARPQFAATWRDLADQVPDPARARMLELVAA